MISLFLFVFGLGSCYQDKGNYDYTDELTIQIDSIGGSYSLYALVDTLKVRPVVTPAGLEYDFHWCIYKTNVQGSVPTLDTLTTERDLVLPLEMEPGGYKIVFMATDRKTGITAMKDASLTLTTTFSEGWFVLRSQNGETDLDLFSTESGKIEDIIAKNNGGRKLKGEATAIDFHRTYKSWDENTGRYVNTSTVFALSSEDALALRTSNATVIRDFDGLFYERPAVTAPQSIVCLSSDLCLINDGFAYSIYGMSPNAGRFGNPAAGDYRLSSFRTYGFRDPLCFDEKSCSFVAVNTMSSTIETFQEKGSETGKDYPPVNNLDADLVYMGPGPDYTGWALLKKRQEEGWLLYNLDANAAYSPYNNPAKNSDVPDNGLRLLQADRWASSQDNNIIYFAQGNKVYSCNIDGGYNEEEQVTVPEGEITYMCYMKYYIYNNPAASFNKLVVAAFDGENYKVYLYDVFAGNLEPNPHVLEGKGKVGALIYINGINKTTLY